MSFSNAISCKIMNCISGYIKTKEDFDKVHYGVQIIIIMLLYAPADTQKRPIVDRKLRKLLKIKSFTMVLILSYVSFYVNNCILKNIIIYSMIIGCICMLPIVYKLLGKEYRNYEKYSNN